jgi:cation transport ATPase
MQYSWELMVDRLWLSRDTVIAAIAVLGIGLHLVLRWGTAADDFTVNLPLYIVLAAGGAPLVVDLLLKALRREFGSDLLAGVSIVTALLLGEYLAGALVVLMLSGGGALEHYAGRRASSVLNALARRMPLVAHRRQGDRVEEAALDDVRIGDLIVIFPHEISPVDGVVIDGHGVMDESYLTGEPFMMPKAPGRRSSPARSTVNRRSRSARRGRRWTPVTRGS